MGNPDEKVRHRKRLQKKRNLQKVKSPIAKALEEPQFHQRVVRDKRGKVHNLETLSHKALVDLIQEKE